MNKVVANLDIVKQNGELRDRRVVMLGDLKVVKVVSINFTLNLHPISGMSPQV